MKRYDHNLGYLQQQPMVIFKPKLQLFHVDRQSDLTSTHRKDKNNTQVVFQRFNNKHETKYKIIQRFKSWKYRNTKTQRAKRKINEEQAR